MNVNKANKYIVGIDEAGRGPLAGPVSVGMVCVSSNFDFSLLKNLRDSKKLPQKQREKWFEKIKEWGEEDLLSYKVAHVGNKIIDRVGIQLATKKAIYRVLKNVSSDNSLVLLDGLLHAPKRFTHQRTIIKGDEKISVISLASICAKESRDKKMRRHSLEYENYGFEHHKGYGTKKHCRLIKKHGLCDIHRKMYCSNLLT